MTVLRRIFQIATIAGIVAISLFSFSLTQKFSINLKQNPISATDKSRQKTQYMTLDAQTLLGNNFTKSFSKEFAKSIVTRYPDGPETVTKENKQRLPLAEIGLSQAKNIVAQLKAEVPGFSVDDISITSDGRLEKLSYLGELKEIWRRHLNQFQNQDLLLLTYNANRKGNVFARKTLAAYTTESEQAINELKAISVPQSFAELHVSLINLIAKSRHTALSFLVETNDPVRTSLAAYTYPDLGKTYFEFNKKFADALAAENLTMSNIGDSIYRSLSCLIRTKIAKAATGSFSCSCDCSSSSGTGCTCNCDISVPLPLPVFIDKPNTPGVEVEISNDSGNPLPVYDDAVYNVLNTYFATELPAGEVSKIQLAQTVQGNIMNFITDQADTICPEEQKYPDTLTCRRGVENWHAVMRDVEDNAKRVFYNDLASLPNEIIGDPLQKQKIIDNLGLIIDRNPVGNVIEEFIKKLYKSEAYHIFSEDGTGTEGGTSIHGNRGELTIALKQYFDSYVQDMKDTTKFMAEIGGGWFGKWECIRNIVNMDTGQERCDPYGGYSYVISPGQMNTIANVVLPTLDIEAAMNSTYFNVIKEYTTLAVDDDGIPTAGLFTDQALTSGIGFMMPGAMGPTEIKPTCQIRVAPFEQHVLMMGTSATSSQRILTVTVYANNGITQKIELGNTVPNVANLVIDQNMGNNISYTWSPGLPTTTAVSKDLATRKIGDMEQILPTITANNASDVTDKIIITAYVENLKNTKPGFKTNTCTQEVTVNTIPDSTCSIAMAPASFEYIDSATISAAGANLSWKTSGGIKYPQIKQNGGLLDAGIKFDVTFTPAITLAQLINTLDVQMTNNLRANNRSFILTPDLPSTSQPSQSNFLLGNKHGRNLEINDLGESELTGSLTILGMTDPLCYLPAGTKIKSGYRSSTTLCPPPTGCGTGGSCPADTMVTESYGGGCRTSYCDYYTGVRLNDGFNAWSINVCP